MKRRLILLLKFVISGAILTLLFYKIPVYEIGKSLGSANFTLIFGSLFIYLICHYLSAFETSYLTKVQGIIISTFQILKIHLATMFYNLFLPGFISGAAVKWYKFSKYGRKSDAAAVVAFNRFLETMMIIFTGIIFSIPIIAARGQGQLIIIWSFLAVFIFTIYFLLLNQKFLSFSEKVMLKIPSPQLIKQGITKLFSSMRKFRQLSLKENFQILGLLFFYHSLGITASYLLALSLSINITFYDVAWIRAAINILTMIPVSFAGLGIREVSMVFFLGYYGIKPDTAMAYSLLLFFNITIVSLSGGLIEFFNFLADKKVIVNSKVNQ